jgi:zinc/manganese transport system substrate-binding protein
MRVVLGILAIASSAACADDGDETGRTEIVVTTTILGDVVRNVVGDTADVEVVMPAGADPHEFSPSTRQAEAMGTADLLVVSGAGFEAGLDSAIDAAEDGGVKSFVAAEHVDLLELEGADDPHIWTDPSRMAEVVDALGEALPERADAAAAYAEELRSLDAEIEGLVADIPRERRVLVTNHEVLGYFADRYGFEVVGAVIPSVTTGAAASAADVEALADLLVAEGVPAVFAETTSSSELAQALADSVGGVEVVTLFTESLGGPGSGAETYIDMQRTNAGRIVEALT